MPDNIGVGRSVVNEPITINHLDDESAEWIEEQASQRGVAKETVVLHLIRQGIDLEQKKAHLPTYHDLDDLAGTWTEEDAAEFERVTAPLRQVDEELWR
jgi:hypothetical protein